MIKKLFFFLFVASTMACTQTTNKSLVKQVYIDFEKEDSTKFYTSQIFSKVSYVNLENMVPVGQIDKVCQFENVVYLCNRNEGKIHQFDTNGKYLTTLNKQGRAGDEYIKLSIFDVSSDNGDVHIYDEGRKRMLVYSKEGNLKRKFDIEDIIRDFAIMDNGNYLMYTPDKNGESRRGLWLTDSDGKFIKQLVDIDQKFQYGGIYPQYLYHIDNKTIGLMGGEDKNNFYMITGEDVSIQMHANFEISIPSELKQQRIIDVSKDKKHIYTKNNYKESHRWLWFHTTDFDKSILCFYDKVNDKCYQVKAQENLIEDVVILGQSMSCYNDKMINVVYASSIIALPELREKFPEVSDTSNPVLEIVELTK